MRRHIAALLEVSGSVVLAAAGWTINETVGLIVAGVGLVAFGVSVERDA